jgi:hypothetical protein
MLNNKRASLARLDGKETIGWTLLSERTGKNNL